MWLQWRARRAIKRLTTRCGYAVYTDSEKENYNNKLYTDTGLHLNSDKHQREE